MNAFFSFIVYLLILGSILFLAYVITRYIAMKAGRSLRGRNIKIIESVSLGIDRGLFLVKVGKQLFLLSSTNKGIELLTSVNGEDIEETAGEPDGLPTGTVIAEKFSKYLESVRSYLKVEDKPINTQNGDRQGTETESAFSRNLDRLKGMFSKPNTKNDGNEG